MTVGIAESLLCVSLSELGDGRGPTRRTWGSMVLGGTQTLAWTSAFVGRGNFFHSFPGTHPREWSPGSQRCIQAVSLPPLDQRSVILPALPQDSKVTWFRYGPKIAVFLWSPIQEERHHSDGFSSPLAATHTFSRATIRTNKSRDEPKSTQSLAPDRSPSDPKFSPNIHAKAERD